MLTAHRWVAVAVIVVAALSAVWGGVTYLRRAEAGPALRQVLALVQTLLVAQVALGLLLVSDGRRAPDELHYAYGTLALAVVLAPWFYAPSDPRRRLAWFSGTSLVAAALAVRAYMTSG
jgi:heme A synthase